MPERFDNASLMDFLAVFWKRRWQIAVPTVILALVAGVLSFLLPTLWDVQALVQPSMFTIQLSEGRLEEVVVVNPRQIVSQINEETYNQRIAGDLGLEPREFPKLRAEHLRDTHLIKVSVREQDVKRGKAVLSSLFDYLKQDLDRKVNVEMKVIETEIVVKEHECKENEINIKNLENKITLLMLAIQSQEIEKARKNAEIEAEHNRLAISLERAESLREEMASVNKRVAEIDAQLQKVLAENHKGSDAVSLLLYSNEVQQNLRFLNTLDESLSLERIAQENLRQSIQDNREIIRQIDTEIRRIKTEIATYRNEITRASNAMSMLRSEIALLMEKKIRIEPAVLIKPPMESFHPVSPNRKLNVAIAGMIGLMVFTMLAFLVEYVDKHKTRPDRKRGNP